jgi:hypothetical protein
MWIILASVCLRYSEWELQNSLRLKLEIPQVEQHQYNLSLSRASARKLRDFPCLRVIDKSVHAIPLEYCSRRKHAFLVGRTQASEFLFFKFLRTPEALIIKMVPIYSVPISRSRTVHKYINT